MKLKHSVRRNKMKFVTVLVKEAEAAANDYDFALRKNCCVSVRNGRLLITDGEPFKGWK